MIPQITVNRRKIGVSFSGQYAEIWLWAPGAGRAELCINNKSAIPLLKQDRGYWHLITKKLQPGDRYTFVLDGKKKSFPDPASLSQPQGVHNASEALDITGFDWTDEHWANPPLDTYIFYELHTGTFTSQGTFEAIGKKLDHLVELGITAIELMPVAAFPGRRNWGYDGVFPFAVHESYGGAQQLQELVDLCHNRGLAVVLDVVYNHLGPEGNYLDEFGPYFTDKYKTPWGNAVNFDDADCDAVRSYFIENALMWLRDFHIDALRLDAVHAIKDFSPVHILQCIREHVDRLSKETGRTYYLLVECDLNDTRFITSAASKGYAMHAQWADEFHHALRVSAGEKQDGYYSDFNGVPDLAKAYKSAYVYEGQYSPHRRKAFGTSTAGYAGEQFIVFSQNHDQVGNRLLGERSSQLLSFAMQKLMAGAVILSPYLPLLFMGEEWAEPSPFLYFVDHSNPALTEAVRKGRQREFRSFHHSGTAPDPSASASFKQSKLQWPLIEKKPHVVMLRYYSELIRLRKQHFSLRHFPRQQLEANYNSLAKSLCVQRWNKEQVVYMFLNFSARRQTISLPPSAKPWNKLLYSADRCWNGPMDLPGTKSGGLPFFIEPESFAVFSNDV